MSPYLLCIGEPRTEHSTPDVSHQCSVEKQDHLPRPVSNAVPNAVRLFCCKDALLAHAHLVFHQGPKAHLCRATFRLISPQHVLVPGVIPPHVLHGILTVLSTMAGTDHIFLIELDKGFDQNVSNIYRKLTKTKCLLIQPLHRSNGTFSMHHRILLTLALVQTFEKLDTREGLFFCHSVLPLQMSLVSATLGVRVYAERRLLLTYYIAAFINGEQECLR